VTASIALWAHRRASAGLGALHSYNSPDHSMIAAIYCVWNVMEGAGLDPWMINTEEEYIEEGLIKKTFDERLVPTQPS